MVPYSGEWLSSFSCIYNYCFPTTSPQLLAEYEKEPHSVKITDKGAFAVVTNAQEEEVVKECLFSQSISEMGSRGTDTTTVS